MGDTKPVFIRYRDMLFPQRLLTETGAEENPWVLQNHRRRRRPARRAALLAMEAALILLAYILLNEDVRRTGSAFFLLLLGFGWLLLRYHLFSNDQSARLKTMTSGQLEHLVLTNLNRDDYFLHHFLLFCLRYRALVGFVALTAILLGAMVFGTEGKWVDWETYWPIAVLLTVILLVWVAGVIQYVAEWRLFVGGTRSRFQPVLSQGISILLAGISVQVALLFSGLHPALIAGIGIAFAAGAAWIALVLGRDTYLEADDRILLPFVEQDVDWSRVARRIEPGLPILFLDLLLPWRWKWRRPTRDAQADRSRGQSREYSLSGNLWDNWVGAFIHGVLFSFLYSLLSNLLNAEMIRILYRRSFGWTLDFSAVLHRAAFDLPVATLAFGVFHLLQSKRRQGKKPTLSGTVKRYGRWIGSLAIFLTLLDAAETFLVLRGGYLRIATPRYLSAQFITLFYQYTSFLILWVAILATCFWLRFQRSDRGPGDDNPLANLIRTLGSVAVALIALRGGIWALQATMILLPTLSRPLAMAVARAMSYFLIVYTPALFFLSLTLLRIGMRGVSEGTATPLAAAASSGDP